MPARFFLRSAKIPGASTLLLLVTALSVNAFRPFITDDAGTVLPVTFELETSADYWHNAATFGVSLKHGITERMDIGVSFARCVLPQDEGGYDPAELLLKFSLIEDRLSTSFGGSFGNHHYEALLIYSHPVSWFSLHGNIGFTSTGPLSGDAFFTFACAGIAEVGRFSVGAEFGATHHSFDWWQLGARFAITDWCAIDAAFGGDFSQDITFNAATGLFFAFPLPGKGA